MPDLDIKKINLDIAKIESQNPLMTEGRARKSSYHHGDLRKALLRAAEEELEEKGVEAFSLRAVAKRAGVSHGAPAHHFTDVPGLLTELAVVGYRRFIATQERYQRDAERNPAAQLAASGLGYIDFATRYPALFRLLFASDRPDREAPELAACADLAFEKLLVDVASVLGERPAEGSAAMKDVIAAWTTAHGLADLMITGRFERIPFFAALGPPERDRLFSELILRAVQH